jgi:hypothetical protein
MTRTTATPDTVRRSIEMHPRTDERIKWLMNELEATSVSEVIRRALQVLETLIADEKRGRRLFVEDERGRLTAVSIRYAGINGPHQHPAAEIYEIGGRGL